MGGFLMKQLLFGAAYYDEYMPYDRLEEDVAMMKKANINTVRIAESTWSTCEPQEGVFDFSHVERVIDAMEKADINVIIGTPTYAGDLAMAIMTAIEKGIVPGVYHFSNEGVISWYDFTKAIHRIAGITTCHVRPLHTSEYPTPANRPAYSVLDKTKIKQTYDIEIPYWEESLAKCIEKLK